MPQKKIFIVDDEVEVLEALSKRLKDDGYEPVTATSGREAVRKVQAMMPDLILMDIVLPDIDGSEAVRLIQQDPKTRSIPIVFLSGIVSNEDKEQKPEVKVGGWNYPAIGKPFPYEALLKIIKANLN